MNDLITASKKFVIEYLNQNLENTFVYHNVAHTQRVVEKVQELIDKAGLVDSDRQLLIVAAWFHDTGYTRTIKNHEEESVLIARGFLKSQKAPEAFLDHVEKLILSTRVTYEPTNDTLEKMIKDADCSHVGSKTYPDLIELLRKEWEMTLGKNFSELEWLDENIKFFTQKHRFYTSSAAELWEKMKGKNLSVLLKRRSKIKGNQKKFIQKEEALKIKKGKLKIPERGIETMFRVTLRNHITLSNIADTKANILLSVNAIIVSLALSNLIPKLDNPSNSYLIYPTIIFVLFTVASIILSVFATRPNVTSGQFTREDVTNKKVNLLFFGNFHKMKLEDFEWAIEEIMQDRDYLYSTMKKDLYYLGLVLNKKYKILRTTYTVFMIGIVLSVISFYVAFQFT